jgi:hypothetical protein
VRCGISQAEQGFWKQAMKTREKRPKAYLLCNNRRAKICPDIALHQFCAQALGTPLELWAITAWRLP